MKVFSAFCSILVLFCFMPRPFGEVVAPQGKFVIVAEKSFESEKTQCQQNGNVFLISVQAEDANWLVDQKVSFVSQFFVFESQSFEASKFLSSISAKVVRFENFENLEQTFAYSPKIKGFVFLKGKKVNVHIAKNGNIVAIGSPLILGSF